MKRTYHIGEDRVEIEEVSAVRAVWLKAAPKRVDDFAAEFGGPVVKMEVEGLEPVQVRSEQERAFREAGWVLVPSEADLFEAAERAEPTAPPEVCRVFLDAEGGLMIGTDRLIVKLRPELAQEEAEGWLREAGLEILLQLRFAPNLFDVRVAAGEDFLDVAERLRQHSSVIYAEPQMIQHIPARFSPTDPDYRHQWQWKNIGQLGCTSGKDVGIEDAWDTTRGAGVRLAVIDNGIDLDHPDLGPPLSGAAFFEENGTNPAGFRKETTGFPKTDHGTQCSGMAVARAENGNSGCGAANQATFIPIACLPDQIGTQATLGRAVAYAADPTQEDPTASSADGADVISCSLGNEGRPWQIELVLADALRFAVNSGRGSLGTPVFWSVDNIRNPIAQDQVCSHPATIAVGRSTCTDVHDNSAFGPELDFLAPGVLVFTTTQGGGGGFVTGTSFATPCAAGIAALVLAVAPTLRWDEVRDILRDTCDKVGGVTYTNGRHDDYGHGRVNARRAVEKAQGV